MGATGWPPKVAGREHALHAGKLVFVPKGARRSTRGVSEDFAYLTVHTGAGALGEAAGDFLGFWQRDTSAHFRKEEEVLLPVLGRYGQDVLDREPVVEMLGQHARIRGLVMQLSDEYADGNLRPETLGEIGESLEAHIRLEEREVFPMIEEVLPKIALEEVASRLAVKEAGPRVEPWVATEGGLSYAPWPGPGDSEGGGWS